MRSVLVGLVVGVLAAGGPAYGGSIVDDRERPPAAAAEELEAPTTAPDWVDVHERPPFREVGVEEYHNAGAELGMGIASTVVSVFYTPVRLAVGVVGAGLGGVEGWLTGGDLRTARTMWRPTVEGDYFIRPDHLDRTERYEFGNWRPVVRERYTMRGREPMLYEESDTVVVPEPMAESEPVEPALEDDYSEDR